MSGPPPEVLNATADHYRSISAAVEEGVAGFTREDLAAPFEARLRADPVAVEAREKIRLAIANLPTPSLSPLGPPFVLAEAAPGQLRVRSAPYDFFISDPPGAATGIASTGGIVIGASAGFQTVGVQLGRQRTTAFINIAVTNESAGSTPGQKVRVSPSISWDAQFELKCYGVPDGFPLSVGADPWTEARGGVAVKVFGQNGQFVTQNEPPVELFQGHHSDSPYSTEPSTLPWTDGGLSTPACTSTPRYRPVRHGGSTSTHMWRSPPTTTGFGTRPKPSAACRQPSSSLYSTRSRSSGGWSLTVGSGELTSKTRSSRRPRLPPTTTDPIRNGGDPGRPRCSDPVLVPGNDDG